MTLSSLSKTDEYYEKYTKPMELPKGKTCSDCIHFERTCKWLISCKPDRITCDWNPSRFKENESI